MMYRLLAAAAATALVAVAAPALAQPAPTAGALLFISPSGEPFRGEDGLADWFAGADADHDGVLTLVELRDDAMRFFKVLDADASGWIEGPENSAYETRIAPEITRMDIPGRPPEKRPFIHKSTRNVQPKIGAARFSLLNEPQPVRGADADLNQRVSAEEWAKAARRRFEILDTDKDDKLTLDGLRARLDR